MEELACCSKSKQIVRTVSGHVGLVNGGKNTLYGLELWNLDDFSLFRREKYIIQPAICHNESFEEEKYIFFQIACCWFHVSMCLGTGALSIKKHLLLDCFRQSNAICIYGLYILVMSIAHMCATHLDQENRCTPEMMFAKMMRERAREREREGGREW